MTPPYRPSLYAAAVSFLLLSACGSDNPPPSALAARAELLEDEIHSDALTASDPDNEPITFMVSRQPRNGTITLDSVSGRYSYSPHGNYFGPDEFSFQASDGRSMSAPASVKLTIAPVEDAPDLQPLSDAQNSAESQVRSIPLVASDPDGDPLTLEARADDTNVADVSISTDGAYLLVSQKGVGATRIEVTVSDGKTRVSNSLQYTVSEAVKIRELSAAPPERTAIVLRNESTNDVEFTLTHNGFSANASVQEMTLEAIMQADAYPGEPVERKIWRYARDNVVHDVPPSEENWRYAPWATMRSMGAGLCSQVATSMAIIARTAGLEARVWGLGGHVVPEVRTDGIWRSYDPDLAVYYKNYAGQVASIDELVANPDLITSPVSPVFSAWAYPYRAEVSEIYASTRDNIPLSEQVMETAAMDHSPPVKLPPGATLTYPGRWTTPDISGGTLSWPDIAEEREAQMSLPAGWTGTLSMPWVLSSIQGRGTVRINGTSYAAEDPTIQAVIANSTSPITAVEIESNEGVALNFFMNRARVYLKPDNVVQVRSVNSWAISIATQNIPAENASSSPSRLTKGDVDAP